MEFRATDKLEPYTAENSLPKNVSTEKNEDNSFMEIASAKIMQKKMSRADISQRSIKGDMDENEGLSFYEEFRRRDSFSEMRRQEKRRFKLEQEAKRKRRARYVQILKESALKRRLREQEAGGRYYTSCTARKLVTASCETGSASVPVSKESIALLLADRELVQKEAEEAMKERNVKKIPKI